MKITIENDKIHISNPTDEISKLIESQCSYTDKSKQYQLKRLGKTSWGLRSPQYKTLKNEVYGKLYKKNDDGSYFISSGFYDFFKDHFKSDSITDNRKLTGKTIALPWLKKPHDLREYQESAVELMGCHALGTPILMFDGTIKNVEDIMVGDQIMGPDSKPRLVSRLNRGIDDFFEIKPVKGESFLVNSHHILSLRRSYSSLVRGKQKYKQRISNPDTEIINISVKDYIAQNKSFKHKYKLYRSSAITFSPKDLLLDPYVLGLWLGDGCSYNTEIATMDTEIKDALTDYCEINNLIFKSLHQKSKATTYSISGQTNIFRNALKELNLIKNKHIPYIYKTASIEQRLQLLAGLIDTDGSYCDGLFDITSKSQQLADDIVFIARSLGLAAYRKDSYKLATNSKNPMKKLYHRITISGDIDLIPTKIKRKQAPPRKQIKNVLNVGFQVIERPAQPFYGFTVDSDHLYVMGDFTITHNCNHRGVINLATGLGKTLLTVHFIKRLKKKTLVVCPSDSVARQFHTELVSAFGENRIGFFGGGKKKIKDITVGIAASVVRNVDLFKKEDLGCLIIDEAHHAPATTFSEIAVGLASLGKIFGLTATDYRSDGKDVLIVDGCGATLIRRDAKWGIENGWLADPCFIVSEIPTTGKDHKDDKLKSYKEHVLNNKMMRDKILEDSRKVINSGKSLLILVDEVIHGKELSEQLGIPFATGEDAKSQEYVVALNKGKVPGLVGTSGKIGEGSDTKNVDVLILANFIASKGPVLQCVGRALRKTATKNKVLILDYIPTGSTMLNRHGHQRIKYYKEITSNVIIKTSS
jgi:superfamily II DNA or RNA helicase